MEPVSPTPGSQPVEPPVPSMSLAGRLLNVFAAPGDVFDDIKAAPHRAANWLVPVLLSIVIGVISCFVIFSQPGVQQNLHEQQAKALDKRVQQGKLTQAQEDQILQMSQRFSTPAMLTIFGSFGVLLNSFASIFWWALVLWLFGRWFLKAQFPYMKAVEVAGVTSMIVILSLVFTTLLAAVLGRLNASPSLALFVSDFDPTRRSHLLLGAVNPIYFWHVGLLGLGLAKLSTASAFKAAAIVFGYWVVAELLLIVVGLGQWTL